MSSICSVTYQFLLFLGEREGQIKDRSLNCYVDNMDFGEKGKMKKIKWSFIIFPSWLSMVTPYTIVVKSMEFKLQLSNDQLGVGQVLSLPKLNYEVNYSIYLHEAVEGIT